MDIETACRISRRSALGGGALLLLTQGARAASPRPVVDGPRGWSLRQAAPNGGPRYWETYTAGHTVTAHDGVLRVAAIDGAPPIPCLVVDMLAGDAVRRRGFGMSVDVVRSEAATAVRLFAKADGGGDTLVEDEAKGAAGRVSTLRVAIPMVGDVAALSFGMLVDGKGEVHFSNLRVTIDAVEPVIRPTPPVLRAALTRDLRRSAFALADRDALAKLVEGRSVIGLGEATHGSAPIFRAKSELVKRLVLDHQFSVVAYEANLPEMDAVDAYVQGGPGDIRAVLKAAGTWPVACEEIVELAEWLRSHNATASRKVRFVGIDAQNVTLAMTRIGAMATSTASPVLLEAVRRYALLGAVMKQLRYDFVRPAEPRREIADAAVAAARIEVGIRDAGLPAPVERDARRMARVIRQTFDGLSASRPSRDAALAENILACTATDSAPAKVVFWAHNGHVMRDRGDFAGRYLHDALGMRYLALGSTIGPGTYTAVGARGLGTYDLLAGLPGSDTDTLGATVPDGTIIDFDRLRAGAAGRQWLASRLEHRSVGAVADSWGYRMRRLGDLYDGLIYLDRTSPSRHLVG